MDMILYEVEARFADKWYTGFLREAEKRTRELKRRLEGILTREPEIEEPEKREFRRPERVYPILTSVREDYYALAGLPTPEQEERPSLSERISGIPESEQGQEVPPRVYSTNSEIIDLETETRIDGKTSTSIVKFRVYCQQDQDFAEYVDLLNEMTTPSWKLGVTEFTFNRYAKARFTIKTRAEVDVRGIEDINLFFLDPFYFVIDRISSDTGTHYRDDVRFERVIPEPTIVTISGPQGNISGIPDGAIVKEMSYEVPSPAGIPSNGIVPSVGDYIFEGDVRKVTAAYRRLSEVFPEMEGSDGHRKSSTGQVFISGLDLIKESQSFF